MKYLKYAVVIERGPENYSAYVPDLPGCVATGRTREDVIDNIRAAIVMHLEGMREDHELIPEPTTEVRLVDVPAA